MMLIAKGLKCNQGNRPLKSANRELNRMDIRMRENRPHGSEGGEAYPIGNGAVMRIAET